MFLQFILIEVVKICTYSQLSSQNINYIAIHCRYTVTTVCYYNQRHLFCHYTLLHCTVGPTISQTKPDHVLATFISMCQKSIWMLASQLHGYIKWISISVPTRSVIPHDAQLLLLHYLVSRYRTRPCVWPKYTITHIPNSILCHIIGHCRLYKKSTDKCSGGQQLDSYSASYIF